MLATPSADDDGVVARYCRQRTWLMSSKCCLLRRITSSKVALAGLPVTMLALKGPAPCANPDISAHVPVAVGSRLYLALVVLFTRFDRR